MDQIDSLIEKITTTTDNSERNKLAIRLMETGDSRAKAALVALIKRPELKNSRGTLVNCLSSFDNSDIFYFLVDLIINGNWEVAHEAFALINNIESLDGDIVSAAYEKISNELAKPQSEDWREPLLRDLLSLFE